MKIRKAIATALTVVALTAASILPAKAANVNVEATYLQNQETIEDVTTLDTKVGGSVIDEKLNWFMRNRTSMNHTMEDSVDSFTLLDLGVPLKYGFGVALENQFIPGLPVDTRAGLDYFGKVGDLSLYALVTRNWCAHPNTEFFGSALYAPKGKLVPYVHLESIFNIGDETYNYDVQRIRLGATYKGVSFGAAADVNGIASGEEPVTSVGGFVNIPIK